MIITVVSLFFVAWWLCGLILFLLFWASEFGKITIGNVCFGMTVAAWLGPIVLVFILIEFFAKKDVLDIVLWQRKKK